MSDRKDYEVPTLTSEEKRDYTIDTGHENSTVKVRANGEVDIKSLMINTRNGDDFVDINASEYWHNLASDKVSRVAGDLTVRTGKGNDMVNLTDVDLRGGKQTLVDLGAGNDVVNLGIALNKLDIRHDRTTIIGGEGYDIVNIKTLDDTVGEGRAGDVKLSISRTFKEGTFELKDQLGNKWSIQAEQIIVDGRELDQRDIQYKSAPVGEVKAVEKGGRSNG